MLDKDFAAKATDYLYATLGHVNIDYVTNIYEEGNWETPMITYVEYVDMQGNPVKNPLDISMRELSKIIVNMPSVEPPPEEEPYIDHVIE